MDGQEALLRGLASSGSGLKVPSASSNIILAAVTRTLRSGRRATRREESIVEREVGNVRSLEMADALSGLRDRRSPDRPGRPRSLQAIQFFSRRSAGRGRRKHARSRSSLLVQSDDDGGPFGRTPLLSLTPSMGCALAEGRSRLEFGPFCMVDCPKLGCSDILPGSQILAITLQR